MNQFVLILWCIYAAPFVSSDNSIVCEDTENGRICKAARNMFRPYRFTLANEGHLLIVGTDNLLYSFSTDSLNLLQAVDISPSSQDTTACINDGHGEIPCNSNSISLVQEIPYEPLSSNVTLQAKYNNTVLVCGTNAVNPRCTVHNIFNLSSWFNLKQSDNVNDLGFSPSSIDSTNVGAMASNGAFYSATTFSQQLKRVAISFDALLGDTSFATRSADRDPFWVSTTDFISLYEVDEHMYIFGREDSDENFEISPSVKFGRVIRICKDDHGINNDGAKPRLQTFQKIRIACPNIGDNDFPEFFYNNLQGTYLHTSSDGSHWIYATFIAQANGPAGSAICKYSFNPDESNSLTDQFSSRSSYYSSSDPNIAPKQLDPFTCPGTERARDDSTGYQLIQGTVLPQGGDTIHTRNGQYYTYINVDVFEFGGSMYEVMFVATQSMRVDIVCHKDGQPFITKTISQYTEDIDNFILDNSLEGIRMLYVGGESFIASIVFGNCTRYSSCKECLESNDPYCAWHNGSLSCINKLVTNYNADVWEASQTANTNICPVLPTPQSTTTMSTTVIETKLSTTKTTEAVPYTIVPSATQLSCRMNQTRTSSVTVVTVSTVYMKSITSDIRETSTIPPLMPSVNQIGVKSNSVSVTEIGQMIGAGVGGILFGVVVGLLLCFVYVLVKGKGSSNQSFPNVDPSYPPHNNGSVQPSIEQYTITVSLPEKDTQRHSNGFVTSPVPPNSLSPPSLSPPAVDDSELEDDVISDLPHNVSNGGGKIKKWNIPKGRTPSTRWLRASESSNAGSESPVSPS